jgi:hypothetical protein
MTVAADLGWPAYAAITIAVLIAGLCVLVWLMRDPRSRRVRFGVFVERDDWTNPPPDDSEPNQ